MFNGKFYHFSTLETLKIETFRFEVRERQRVRDLINSFFAYCQKKDPGILHCPFFTRKVSTVVVIKGD